MHQVDQQNTNGWPDELIGLLERQHGLVDRLGELSERQQSLIAERETEELLTVLGERQSVINEFTSMQSEMSSLTTKLNSLGDDVANGAKGKIQKLVDEIGEGLAKVMRRDAEDEAVLQASRNQIRNELLVTERGQQARNAYGNRMGMRPRFSDERG